MKKVCVLFIILTIMYISLGPLRLQGTGPTFSIDTDIPAARGSTITVPIVVNNNPGFVAVGLVVNYDPRILRLTGVTAPVPDMSLNQQFQLSATPGTQWISLINTNLTNWAGNGAVANVTFDVIANASIGSSGINLSFTANPDGTPASAAGYLLGQGSGANMTVGGSVSVQNAVPTPSPAPQPGQGGGSATQPQNPGSAAAPGQNSNTPPGGNTGDNNPSTGDFIGNPSTSGNTGTGQSAPPGGSNPSNSSGFGNVPQTGIAGFAGMAVLMFVLMLISASMWVYVFHHKKSGVKNG